MSTRERYHRAVSDLADKILDKALAGGAAFSEGLCNWAISKAEETVRKPD